MLDLRLLRLDTIIIHRVPKKVQPGAVATVPTLSDAPTPDRDDVKVFFQRRVRAAVEDRGLAIEVDPDQDRAASDAIDAMLSDAATLTPHSRELAGRLFDKQDLRNPTGLLVVGTGTVGDRRAVALLKIEHDTGIRAEERRINGQLTFEVVVHNDLLLTPNTQLFKAAVFAHDGHRAIEALGADMQVSGGIADFFLEAFLGFRLHETPAVTTERFLDAAEKWAGGQVRDPEKQARYEMALVTQLQSAQRSVNVPLYADMNIDVDDHQSFREAIVGGGVRWGTFRKDTSRVDSRIKRVAYNFASGIKIVGRPEAVQEHLTVETLDQMHARVTIEDELRHVHTHG